jgi:hypothetical protein
VHIELNTLSTWAAILSLQQAISLISDELDIGDSLNLSDWGEMIEDELQQAVKKCVSHGLKEEAVSDAIDAGMPPMLAYLRRRVPQ